MKVTMIGHSTVLIEIAGTRILTDPYFGTWGNPLYARLAPPFKSREEMKAVDLVLVSHNHWDHTDSRYFRSLADTVPVVTPHAAVWMTRLQGARNVVGLKQWEQKQLAMVRVTAVPALHLAIPCGFVIEGEGRQIYFAGDTYYSGFMHQIGSRFSLDLALMPVTTYRIPMTMGENGAERAVQTLSPRTVIPIHLGLLPRAPLLWTKDTPEHFRQRLFQAGSKTEVVVLREGQSWAC